MRRSSTNGTSTSNRPTMMKTHRDWSKLSRPSCVGNDTKPLTPSDLQLNAVDGVSRSGQSVSRAQLFTSNVNAVSRPICVGTPPVNEFTENSLQSTIVIQDIDCAHVQMLRLTDTSDAWRARFELAACPSNHKKSMICTRTLINHECKIITTLLDAQCSQAREQANLRRYAADCQAVSSEDSARTCAQLNNGGT